MYAIRSYYDRGWFMSSLMIGVAMKDHAPYRQA